MASFIQDYYLLFMLILLSLTVLIFLRTLTGVLIQLAYFAIMVLIHQADISWIINIMGLIQVILTLAIFYWLKTTVDRNYRIVLEKTHLIGRNLTEHNYTGIKKKSFFSYK